MKKIEEILKTKDVDAVREYIEECQTEYYMSDDDVVYKDFKYGISGYDKLTDALELDEGRDILINEMIDRELFLDVITIFKTNTYDLYFARMEQYGYADDDAVVYRLAFCKDVKRLLEDCKEFAKDNDFIKERNDHIGKPTVGGGYIARIKKNSK